MDEESVLFGIRNLFALGNYQALINEVTSTRNLHSPDAKLEAQIYLYRSYVAQGKYNLVLSDIQDTDADAGLKAVRLLSLYLQQKSKALPTDDLVQQAKQFFEEGSHRVHPVVQVVIATLLVNAGKYDDALQVLHVRTKKLECVALAVQIYLQIDRLDLARSEVNHAKSWAEDALLLQMMEAWVGLRVGGEKYQEAFYIFEEFGQSSTGQTVRVLNGQATANLAMGRYPEAESLLLEALNKNSDDPETLVNMITCSNLMAKTQDTTTRYINQLREVAPQHPFLVDLDLKSSLFDRSATRFSLVDAS
ncbi:coatomer epsilon subunit-domain-containing protein [Halteromyces radiatus]|uniref:coatomer epsilon subunit-domain-containing protein n=1 Tax=Halteromyces radiatus TaxID=101107 RepID=UPI00221E7C1A|nr:coatomer epsilon subunit-domain-containing protein [Halteromyces radiatus]KAI8081287.1 coatomer epsilon subunit-domain-containing protein [Halteromyces radiatus]